MVFLNWDKLNNSSRKTCFLLIFNIKHILIGSEYLEKNSILLGGRKVGKQIFIANSRIIHFEKQISAQKYFLSGMGKKFLLSQSCFLDPKLIKQRLASFFLEVQIGNILGLQALQAQPAHYSLPVPSLKSNLHVSSEVLQFYHFPY